MLTETESLNTEEIKPKNVLELNHIGAKDFFLKADSYFRSELPPYIDFSIMLNKVNENFPCPNMNPNRKIIEYVNHTIFTNKDGLYAWRPLTLIHPYLYVKMINDMCKESNWKTIQQRFKYLKQNSCISCHSIPVISTKRKNQAEQILH